jgi:hypothetical protein
MAIVSSEIISQSLQSDGRTLIKERHTDHVGEAHDYEYIGAADEAAAVMAARVSGIVAALRDEDLNRCIFLEAWNYTLIHATNTELAAFVRLLYRYASKDILARVAARILEWIANGRFTDTQIRNAFGLTAGQWTTLKTKMQTLVANYNAVQAAEGE